MNAVHESESVNTFPGVTSGHGFLMSTHYGDLGLEDFFFFLMGATNILHNEEIWHFSFGIKFLPSDVKWKSAFF